MKIILLFWIFVVRQNNAFDPEKFNYCRIHCIFQEPHSACKCEGPNTIITEGTDEFRKTILKMINDYRNGTAAHVDKTLPPAANMMVLKYSMELEHIAKCYAKKFSSKYMEHDLCRRKHDRGTVGQTYYWQTRDVMAFQDRYRYYRQEWHEQMQNYKGDKEAIISSYEDGEGINFYAQINWAETTEVGCIRARGKRRDYLFFIICNFADAGCINKKPIYLTGKACTKCPENSKCKKNSEYPLLCYPLPIRTTTRKALPNVIVPDTFPLMFREFKPTPNASDLIHQIFMDNKSDRNQGVYLVLLLYIVTCFVVFLY